MKSSTKSFTKIMQRQVQHRLMIGEQKTENLSESEGKHRQSIRFYESWIDTVIVANDRQEKGVNIN